MRTLGTILLTFSLSTNLISAISYIPFINFAITLLGFPLALKLSIKELFTIHFISGICGIILQFNLITQALEFVSILLNATPFFTQLYFYSVFFIGATIGLIFVSISFSLIMKLLSRFTPNRIKVVINEG